MCVPIFPVPLLSSVQCHCVYARNWYVEHWANRLSVSVGVRVSARDVVSSRLAHHLQILKLMQPHI